MVERIKLPSKSRQPRVHIPKYIIIHTTQGKNVISSQYSATINWMTQGGGTVYPSSYGPSTDIVIGHLGQEAFLTDQQDQDYHKTRPNWSAGYGESSRTTFGADEYGISIELAQTSAGERPTAATLTAAAKRCALLCDEFDIPIQHINHLSQIRDQVIPGGIVGHEDTANGIKTGKWDPNKKTFQWDAFIKDVRRYANESQPEPEPSGEVRVTNAYIVQSGDNLSKIAVLPGMPTVAELIQWNSITDPNLILVGQVLRLGPNVTRAAAATNIDLVDLAEARQRIEAVTKRLTAI